uniref:Uncharacterized protein n=1 Tax=Timema poppense TaxID=170557 RepID=A0A7R9D234_TIMPO|nr:unnamed protein product [Timema poppensis]
MTSFPGELEMTRPRHQDRRGERPALFGGSSSFQKFFKEESISLVESRVVLRYTGCRAGGRSHKDDTKNSTKGNGQVFSENVLFTSQICANKSAPKRISMGAGVSIVASARTKEVIFLYMSGKGVGSLVGGYLMKGFGTRSTFRIFSVMCTITGIGYFLFNRFYLSRRPQSEGNEIGKKKVVPPTQDDGGQMEIALTQKGEKNTGDIEKTAKSNGSNVECDTFSINSTSNNHTEKDGEHLNHSADKYTNEAYVKDELEDEIKTQTHTNNAEINRLGIYKNSSKTLSEAACKNVDGREIRQT